MAARSPGGIGWADSHVVSVNTADALKERSFKLMDKEDRRCCVCLSFAGAVLASYRLIGWYSQTLLLIALTITEVRKRD